tara:strand:+ start:310 stop:612 length:303 start_codon:yes stop_codon:yes gene_type:complete
MTKIKNNLATTLVYLEDIIKKRNQGDKSNSYTKKLLKENVAKVSQKLGEEAIELVIAANGKDKKEIIHESADLLYHLFVLWQKKGIDSKKIAAELERRKK